MCQNQTSGPGELLKSACTQCPFRRDVDPGICATKNSTPEQFIGQAFGPFMLPCHLQPGFDEDCRDPELKHCRGAASFRASLKRGGKLPRLPEFIPVGPEDAGKFFGTPEEFMAHHLSVKIEDAAYLLRRMPPAYWTMVEMSKAGAKVIKRPSAAASA